MCDICTRKNKTIECTFCHQSAFADCNQRWMIDKTTPTCMFCNKELDMSDLKFMFSKKRFKIIQSDTLLNVFKQECIIDKQNITGSMMIQKKAKKDFDRLCLEKQNILKTLEKVNDAIVQLNNRIAFPHLFQNIDLNGPCHYNQCNGHLNQTNFCDICENYTCPDCKGVYHTDHECDSLNKASVSHIINNCKECPVCKVQITKIEGCNEMWCTQCKSSFDWKTNKIIKLTHRFHNPHYFEYNNAKIVLLNEQLNSVSFAQLRSILIKNEKELSKELHTLNIISNVLNIKKNCSEMIYVVNNLTVDISINNEEGLKRAYLMGSLSEESIRRILVRKNVSNSKKKQTIIIMIQYLTSASELLLFVTEKTNDKCFENLNESVTSLQNNFLESCVEYNSTFKPSYFQYTLDAYGRFFKKN